MTLCVLVHVHALSRQAHTWIMSHTWLSLPVLVTVIRGITRDCAQLFAIATECLWREFQLQKKPFIKQYTGLMDKLEYLHGQIKNQVSEVLILICVNHNVLFPRQFTELKQF